MLGAKIITGLLCGGGALTVGGSIVMLHGLQGEQLDLVERYGLLGLHAAVVLGLGSAVVKIGWELVKSNRQIATVLRAIAEKQKDDRRNNDSERDAAVDVVTTRIDASRDEVLRELKEVRAAIGRKR